MRFRLLILLLLMISNVALGQFRETQKQEFFKTNQLPNGGFERGKSKWTTTGSSTLSLESVFANRYEGTKAGIWTATANGETLTSNPITVPAGWGDEECYARIKYDSQEASGTFILKAQTGGGDPLGVDFVIAPTIAVNKWQTADVAFLCPSSGTYLIKIESTAAGTIKIDKGWLGEDPRLGESAGGRILSTELFVVPSDVITDTTIHTFNVLIGRTYQIIGQSGIHTGTASVTAKIDIIHDGSTLATGSSYEDTTSSFHRNAINTPTFVATAATVTIDSSGTTGSAATQSYILGDGTQENTWFELREISKPQGTVSNDSVKWFIDANIGGGNVAMGLTAVTTYQGAGSATLDLVKNPGSALVGISCESTNDNDVGNLTCPSGNEHMGIIFDVPVAGYYKACAGFSHLVEGMNTYFQIVRTANGSQTIADLGNIRIGSGMENANNPKTTINGMNVCGYFNFVIGKTTIRLFREQTITGSASINTILLDRGTNDGQRDMHWSVKLETGSNSSLAIVPATATTPGGVTYEETDIDISNSGDFDAAQPVLKLVRINNDCTLTWNDLANSNVAVADSAAGIIPSSCSVNTDTYDVIFSDGSKVVTFQLTSAGGIIFHTRDWTGSDINSSTQAAGSFSWVGGSGAP